MTNVELRALREKLGLTQAELGERLGITASAVAHLESGKNTMSKPVAMLAASIRANAGS